MNPASPQNQEYGRMAEQAAADYLVSKGFVIRHRNWSPPSGHVEIDIVAQRGTLFAFVEVKARSGTFTDPMAAVSPRKITLLTRAANAYLHTLQGPEADMAEARFDVIAVSGNAPPWNIEHIPDAFVPPIFTVH